MFTQVDILVHLSASQCSFLKSLDNKEARLLIKFLNSRSEVIYFMYRDVKMYNVCYDKYNQNCDHSITKDDNLLLITNTYFHGIIVC